RDWRPFAMTAHGNVWEVRIPVRELDVPLVYFIESRVAGMTEISPLRICHPDAAGLTEPTRHFWPFIEGFEEDLSGWRLVDAPVNAPPLTVRTNAHNGHAALWLEAPGPARRVAVATTRVRGWEITAYGARGLQL